jgi:hypothetical protein
MAKKKVRDLKKEARWRKIVTGQRRSGQTVRQYCRDKDLTESAFWFWKRELARRDAENAGHSTVPRSRSARQRHRARATSIIPVTIGPALPYAAAVEVSLPRGVSVRVATGCDEATLRMVLSALENGT